MASFHPSRRSADAGGQGHEPRSGGRLRFPEDPSECRGCGLTPWGMPRPERFIHELKIHDGKCVDCFAKAENVCALFRPDPDDPYTYATDHRGMP